MRNFNSNFATGLLTFLVLSLISMPAGARTISFGDLDRAVPTGITVTSDTVTSRVAPALTFRVHLANVEVDEVETTLGKFTRMTIPGYHDTDIIGAPAIPVMNRIIEIPHGAAINTVVNEVASKEYNLVDLDIETRLMPRQAPQPKDGTEVPFAFDLSAYINEGWQADELISVTEIGMMRNHRLALVTFRPVAYDPASRKIRVASDMDVRITLEGSDVQATLNAARVYGSSHFNAACDRIMIPESLAELRSSVATSSPALLIVSDRMFENALAPFIEWKKKNLIVKVAYTDEIGSGSEAVKTYIHDLYNNPTTEFPAPTFVLFVGDHDQIPAFRGTTGSHITDLNFVAVTDDNIPDILTGRFSARNVDELVPQIEKTLYYEQKKFADPKFMDDVVLIAGWDSRFTVSHGYPQIKYGIKNYFNAANGFRNVSTFLSAGSGQNVSAIQAAISKGCSFVNYTAHGSPTVWADPSMSISDINSLKNEGKYPVVVGNCCLTNKFETGTCFGEAWLRAPKKGAIGYIGGTNSTYWDEDLWWGNGYYPIPSSNPQGNPPETSQTGTGAYDHSFSGKPYTMASMMVAGNLAVEESSSPRKKMYWEIYQLMGDPSLQPYIGSPKN